MVVGCVFGRVDDFVVAVAVTIAAARSTDSLACSLTDARLLSSSTVESLPLNYCEMGAPNCLVVVVVVVAGSVGSSFRGVRGERSSNWKNKSLTVSLLAVPSGWPGANSSALS